MEISHGCPRKTHIVVLTSLGMSQIIPSLELSKSLVSLNDDLKITLIIPNTPKSFKAQTLIPTPSLNQDLNIINLPPLDISFPNDLDLASQITTVVRESLPSVRSIIERLNPFPSVLVTDLFGTDAFEVIGDHFNMTKYLFYTSSLISLTFLAYLPKLDWTDLTREEKKNDEIGESLIRVPGCRPLRVHELGESFSDPNSGSYLSMLYHTRRFGKLSGILVNTFDDFEIELTKSLNDDEIRQQIPLPRVYQVGPLIQSTVSSPDGQPSHPCLAWLKTQPSDSVLFVSFGSGAMLPAEQVTELAWGLELSRQRFIWVVRKPVDHSAINGAYLSGGMSEETDPSEFLPDGFMNRTRGVGMVVLNWAPQVEILSRESVGGFLSHCGWNSTLESITNGVPIIPWPLFAEQHMNASMLSHDAKVGLRSRIQKEKGGVLIGRKEIEKMARLIMEGEEGKKLRRKAKELKNKAFEASGKGGSSYNSISKIAEEWRAYSENVNI